MGKNVHGGSGHKKFARKHNSGNSNQNLRVSLQEDEVYAIVIKMLGNNMFHCIGIDSVPRLGRIRGKFTGRGKRDNMVAVGTWVLIGLREWGNTESRPQESANKKKLNECDLLEVYNDSDKLRLTDTVSAPWHILSNHDETKKVTGLTEIDSSFTFATEKDIERERLIDEINSDTVKKVKLTTYTDDAEEEINIDDI
jgi:translation initiation factor IF-1